MFLTELVTFIQLVTETMPISSSAHVQLVKNYYNYLNQGKVNENNLILNQWWIDCVHLPTVMMGIIFLCIIYRHFFFEQISNRKCVELSLIIIIADLITAAGYFFILPLLPRLPIFLGLIVTTIILFLTSYVQYKSIVMTPMMQGIILGIVQMLSLMPGISRFASIFLTAKVIGYNSYYAFLITWLMGLPLMAAAGIKALFYNWQLVYYLLSMSMVVTISLATVLSIATFYISYTAAMTNHLFLFGWYMILPIIFSILVG